MYTMYWCSMNKWSILETQNQTSGQILPQVVMVQPWIYLLALIVDHASVLVSTFKLCLASLSFTMPHCYHNPDFGLMVWIQFHDDVLMACWLTISVDFAIWHIPCFVVDPRLPYPIDILPHLALWLDCCAKACFMQVKTACLPGSGSVYMLCIHC